jgi:hypothetical protein
MPQARKPTALLAKIVLLEKACPDRIRTAADLVGLESMRDHQAEAHDHNDPKSK